MKILHYINNLGSGGAEKLLTDILPLMKKEGYDVSLVISNSNRNMNRHEEVFKSNGIKIIDLNTSFYNPLQIISLIKLINRDKYDIVHGHLFPSQYWLAFASFFLDKKIKLIKTEHSVHNERKNYKLLRFIEKFIYNRYFKVIAITDQVNDNLAEWLQNIVKIDVIHNGVNIQQVKEAQILEPNLFSSHNVNLLMVGRFDGSQKDQATLIQSLSLLPEKFHLFLAGEGPFINESKKLVNQFGLKERVHFLGMRQDVYSLMKQVDLIILSTNHEGLSGVALESLASGKPFIGSDVVGVNNVVPNNKFLFQKGNPEFLASKIEEIISNKALQELMVKQALEHVNNYDITIMAEKYLDLYKVNLTND
jgi:glycosyltransferase involved in cell wall biosynthesis